MQENPHARNPYARNPYARKSASQAVLSRMQLTLHATRRTPHGASRLVLAMSPWSVETRRAPSRHCRDARVYGPTTTAMLDDEYTPPHTRTPFPASIFFIRISPVHVSVLAGAKENAVLVSPSHRRDSRYVSREIMHLSHGTVRDDAKQCRSFGAQCLG